MFERRRATNVPIRWSSSDEELLLDALKNRDFTYDKIKEKLPNRSTQSIRSKVRKLRIKHDLFGDSYRADKTEFTEKYAEQLKPNIVFEGYCGSGNITSEWTKFSNSVFCSDRDIAKADKFAQRMIDDGFKISEDSGFWKGFHKSRKSVFHYCGDVLDAALELRFNGITADVVDLDTCGSTIPLIPILVNVLKPKYLCITHGEFHSLRFKRDDVLRRVLSHRSIFESNLKLDNNSLAKELDKTVKVSLLRAHNEVKDSWWADLIGEQWLGRKNMGMLRRIYKIEKAKFTADRLNELIQN